MSGRAPILVVDNHDSFVHTLVGYLHELGADTDLVEADAIDPRAAASVVAAYRGVLISPGPGAPAGRRSLDRGRPRLRRRRTSRCSACASGIRRSPRRTARRVSHAPELMHGMTSLVEHDGSALYAGLPNPFTATRYHSLAIVPETLPARAPRHESHRTGASSWASRTVRRRIVGVQFHPEAVLTEGGHRLLGNWLETAGIADAAARGAALHPRR